MRVTWDATIAVTMKRAKELGHTLTAFGPKEGHRFGMVIRRAKCTRCGLPFLIRRNPRGLLVVVGETTLETPCEGSSLRQPAA